MWFLRILTGDQAGQLFLLKEGQNIIGRSPTCSIQIPASQMSKQHMALEVEGQNLILKDLNSKNGVLVNGSKVQTHSLCKGDKILVHNIMMDIVKLVSPQNSPSLENSTQHNAHTDKRQKGAISLPLSHSPLEETPYLESGGAEFSPPSSHSLLEEKGQLGEEKLSQKKLSFFEKYIEEGFLPGLYKMMEWMGFQGALTFFIGIFIVLFALFSFVPLIHVFKLQALEESQKRALTLARTVALLNQEAVLKGMESTVDVSFMERESGVQKAFIISSEEGVILAPSLQAGQYPKLPFVHSERKKNQDFVKQIDNHLIIALSPISEYDPQLNLQKPKAHAVIVYSLKALGVENERILSFLIQVLFISLLAGGVLIFLLFKCIDHPLKQVNKQIDQALKDEHTNVELPYHFPELEKLISNLKSILSRISYSKDNLSLTEQETSHQHYDRTQEMENLVQLIGYPATTFFLSERKFGPANELFSEKIGSSSSELSGSLLQDLRDESLKLNLQDLLIKVEEDPQQLALDQLEFSGENHQIAIQSIFGGKEVAYVVITLLPMSEEG